MNNDAFAFKLVYWEQPLQYVVRDRFTFKGRVVDYVTEELAAAKVDSGDCRRVQTSGGCERMKGMLPVLPRIPRTTLLIAGFFVTVDS